jgi:hypothetical protein
VGACGSTAELQTSKQLGVPLDRESSGREYRDGRMLAIPQVGYLLRSTDSWWGLVMRRLVL